MVNAERDNLVWLYGWILSYKWPPKNRIKLRHDLQEQESRNVTLVWKFWLAKVNGNERSAPSFSRIVLPLLLIVQPVTFRNKLKIYQWNADSIRPKFLELRGLLINSEFDVSAVQESKLWKADKTLFIEGYTIFRKDRDDILGGGLLLFIVIDIVFEKLHSFKKVDMEILSICLKTTKSTCLELYNRFSTKQLHSTQFIRTLSNQIKSVFNHSRWPHRQLSNVVSTSISRLPWRQKLSTGSSKITYTSSMTALLLELVKLPVTIASRTSSSVGAIGEPKHPGDSQSLLVAPTISQLLLK